MAPSKLDRAAAAKRDAQILGMQASGLMVLSLGLGLLAAWLGIAALGMGVLLLGISKELERPNAG